MDRITYLLRGQTRRKYVSCTDGIPMSMSMNVFGKPYDLVIVRLILVNM